jgi:3-phytase
VIAAVRRALGHGPVIAVAGGCFLAGCRSEPPAPGQTPVAQAAPAAPSGVLSPVVVSDRVKHDTDDPAIWLNPADPTQSLIIGTDKDEEDGALYAFGLDGKVVRVTATLKRPNNVDVEYGLALRGAATDVAVATERVANKIRVFRLPDLTPIDCGGIDVFGGEAQRLPMGLALYKRPSDGAVFAVVGRKTGPTSGYLWQYRLEDDGKGCVKGTKVRAFGAWSGRGEIEAIAVDDALGYVYYADEPFGVRKYRADPDAPDAGKELAVFGTDGFKEDREGISIYTATGDTGYILVSDQQANQFHVFPREGWQGNPHAHPRLKIVKTKTEGSDGSDVTSAALGGAFPKGLFVAMSQDGTFQLYSWADLAGRDLTVAPTSVSRIRQGHAAAQ